MNTARVRDPVTAISEAGVTGRTAEIFADIREVMQIPLITSTWRMLAAVKRWHWFGWPHVDRGPLGLVPPTGPFHTDSLKDLGDLSHHV